VVLAGRSGGKLKQRQQWAAGALLCRSPSEEEKGRKREREREKEKKKKKERLGHADPKRMGRREKWAGLHMKESNGPGFNFFLSVFYYLARLLKRK
jgi:hypothetical protein